MNQVRVTTIHSSLTLPSMNRCPSIRHCRVDTLLLKLHLLFFGLKEVNINPQLGMRLTYAFEHPLIHINSLNEIFAVQGCIERVKFDGLKTFGHLIQ